MCNEDCEDKKRSLALREFIRKKWEKIKELIVSFLKFIFNIFLPTLFVVWYLLCGLAGSYLIYIMS